MAADKTYRAHAIIENVNADLKNFALVHMPSGRFPANGAWHSLAVIVFNLIRAVATLISQATLAKATIATLRRTLISVLVRWPSTWKLQLHLPLGWPWRRAWEHFTPQPSPVARCPDHHEVMIWTVHDVMRHHKVGPGCAVRRTHSDMTRRLE